MAQFAGALAVASAAFGGAQGVHGYAVSRANVKRERRLAELRAEERREELRRVLAAQRVALASQGSVPGVGSGRVLQQEAVRRAQQSAYLDQFQTQAAIQQHRAEGWSAILRGLGTATSSLASYGYARRETKLGRQGG